MLVDKLRVAAGNVTTPATAVLGGWITERPMHVSLHRHRGTEAFLAG